MSRRTTADRPDVQVRPPAKVVARFRDGRVMKGYTRNFDASRPSFSLTLLQADDQEPVEIRMVDLKAVFFVKTFEGRREYNERKEFAKAFTGRRLAVRFHDGEVLVGTSFNYSAATPGFFLFPADDESNNEKLFVVAASVKDIMKLQGGALPFAG
jgi:hypothetical protein